MDKNLARQLKIKTGAVKRTQKDYNSYAKETKTLEEKLEKLKADEAEAHAIKNMEDQVAETAQMIPNSKTRVQNSIEDLKNFMSENEENDELKATEDWQQAEAALAEAVAFIETI